MILLYKTYIYENHYIQDCDEGADIIVAHNAKSKEELRSMVEEGRWNDLLRKIPIKKGSHFILPCGYGTVEFAGNLELIICIYEVEKWAKKREN